MNFDKEISLEMKKSAVQDIRQAGFKVKKIPEWEMGVRGTIKIDAMDELPPMAESMMKKNDEEEQKAT